MPILLKKNIVKHNFKLWRFKTSTFYCHEDSIILKDAVIEKVLVSKNIFYGEKNYT